MSYKRPQGRGTILGGSRRPLLRSVVHVLEQTQGRGTILGGSRRPLLRSVVHVLEQTAG